MAKKIYEENLVKTAAEARSRGKEWLNETQRKGAGFFAGVRGKRLPDVMVRRAVKAGRADDWSELMKSDEL